MAHNAHDNAHAGIFGNKWANMGMVKNDRKSSSLSEFVFQIAITAISCIILNRFHPRCFIKFQTKSSDNHHECG